MSVLRPNSLTASSTNTSRASLSSSTIQTSSSPVGSVSSSPLASERATDQRPGPPGLPPGTPALPGTPGTPWPYRMLPEMYPGFGENALNLYPAALASGSGLYPGAEKLNSLAQAPHPFAMDPAALAAYSYGATGFSPYDINGARRKNATRETTSTLKAWLQEHRKNPYPTKGEKIMLAIITKMTLTQVSTWFANARRRLKKENKMTWEPRNRGEEDDDEDDETSRKDENKDRLMEDDEDIGRPLSDKDDDEELNVVDDTQEEDDRATTPTNTRPPTLTLANQEAPSTSDVRDGSSNSPSEKPKIWSIADVATNKPSETPCSAESRIPTSHAALKPGVPAIPMPYPALLKVGHWLNASYPYPLIPHLAGIPAGIPSAFHNHPALLAAQQQRLQDIAAAQSKF